MERNVGGRDRTARGLLAVAFGAAALAAGATGRVGLAVVAALAAAGMAFNYVTQFCGANYLLGRDTCSVDPGDG